MQTGYKLIHAETLVSCVGDETIVEIFDDMLRLSDATDGDSLEINIDSVPRLVEYLGLFEYYQIGSPSEHEIQIGGESFTFEIHDIYMHVTNKSNVITLDKTNAKDLFSIIRNHM